MKKKDNSRPAIEWGQWLFIASICGVFLIFTTMNTTAFVVPKSFFLRFSMFSLAIYYIMTAGLKIRAHAMNFPLFCFALALFSSVLSSENSHVSIIRFSEYCAYFLVFLFTVNYFDRDSLKKFSASIIYLSIPIIIYGFFQYLQIDFAFWEKPEGRMDLFSTIGNVNWYGAFLTALIPLLIRAAAGEKKSSIHFWLYSLLLFSAAATVIMTYSRAAFFAMALSLIFGSVLFAVMNGFSIPAKALKTAAVYILVILLLAGIFSSYNFISSSRFAEGGFFNRMKAGFSTADHNIAQRFFVWRVSYEIFRHKPVLGVGCGMFKVKYLDYQKSYLDSLNNDPYYDEIAGNAKEAHNEYIQMAAETGIAGLLCMFYFFFSIYKLSIRAIRDEAVPYETRATVLAHMTALSALMLDALADFPLHVPCNGALIFALCGALAVLTAPEKNKNEELKSVPDNSTSYMASVSPAEIYSLKIAAISFIAIVIIFVIIMPFAADCITVTGQTFLKEHKFDKAIPYLENAISLNPAQGDALYLLGTAYIGMASPAGSQIDQEKLKKGRDLLLRARNYASDKGIYNNLGFIAIRTKELDDAVIFFEKALGCDPKSPDSLNNLGIVHFHKGSLEKAEFYYRKALKFNPYFITATNNLGDLYSKKNLFPEAEAEYLKVLNLAVEDIINENIKRNIFNFNRATCGSEMGRSAYQIGEIKYAAGKLEEALKFYNSAYSLVPSMPQIPLKIGLVTIKTGKRSEGRAIVEGVMRNLPETSEYYKQAAEILSKY